MSEEKSVHEIAPKVHVKSVGRASLRRRTIWIAFALLGCLYLLMVLKASYAQSNSIRYPQNSIASRLGCDFVPVAMGPLYLPHNKYRAARPGYKNNDGNPWLLQDNTSSMVTSEILQDQKCFQAYLLDIMQLPQKHILTIYDQRRQEVVLKIIKYAT